MQYKNIFQKILTGSNAIGSLLIFGLMLIITYDVASRTLFNYAFVGTPELVSNSLIAIAFLQIGYVLMEGRHVRATILYDKFSERVRIMLDIFTYFVGLALFLALIYSSWSLFITAVKVGEFEGEGALRVPTSPTRFIILYGSVLMSCQFIGMIIDSFKKLFTKKPAEIEKPAKED